MKDDLLLINKFSSDEVFYFGNKTKFKDFVKNVILARAKRSKRGLSLFDHIRKR